MAQPQATFARDAMVIVGSWRLCAQWATKKTLSIEFASPEMKKLGYTASYFTEVSFSYE
jgi:hypothetical protein